MEVPFEEPCPRVYDVPGARLVRQTEGEGGCAAFQEVAFADEGEVAAFRGTRTVDRPLAAPKESGEADGEEEVEEDMEPDAASPDEEEEKGGVEEAPEEDEEEGGEEERNEGPPVEAPDAERDEEPESGEKVDEAQVVDGVQISSPTSQIVCSFLPPFGSCCPVFLFLSQVSPTARDLGALLTRMPIQSPLHPPSPRRWSRTFSASWMLGERPGSSSTSRTTPPVASLCYRCRTRGWLSRCAGPTSPALGRTCPRAAQEPCAQGRRF